MATPSVHPIQRGQVRGQVTPNSDPRSPGAQWVAAWRKKYVDGRGVGSVKMPAAAYDELVAELNQHLRGPQ